MSTNGKPAEPATLNDEQLDQLADRVAEKLRARPFGKPKDAIALVAAGQVCAGHSCSLEELHAALRDLGLPLHRLNYVPHVDEDDLPAVQDKITQNRRATRRR
jgi:hypothetical protein